MVEEHAVRTRVLSTLGHDYLRLEADHGDYCVLHLFSGLVPQLIALP
jgi:hypothetical protein